LTAFLFLVSLEINYLIFYQYLFRAMKPVIAIVGRPNVGKSTLFNRLTNSRTALVADEPGVTRDRQYGNAWFNDHAYILVDTGGLEKSDTESGVIADLITRQSLLAAREADAVIWLVDGRDGLTAADENLAKRLRAESKKLFLAVNKTEGQDESIVTAEFHALGAGRPYAVSAQRGSGLPALMGDIFKTLPLPESGPETESPGGLKLAVIGRPNVGKSTLVNRILGEDRVLTFDQPGTTRDSIAIPFERDGKPYVLIDTAGVRRRARVDEYIEKISVIKTLQAIDETDIVILVIDAHDSVTDQDASLLGLAIQSGKALMIAVNKWDGLDDEERSRIRNQLDRKLGFVEYACIHFISALHGSGVGKMFEAINRIGRSLASTPATSRLNSILQECVRQHEPPLVQGRRIKLRYAHLGGHNPLRVIIHGNQTEHVPDAYRRYLANHFRKSLKLTGTPVMIEFRQGENPFKGKKNILTPRQKAKRKRLLQHKKS
jgi:GTP-binding protein